jgi:serine/threonine-protein kinase RsbW
MADEQGSVVHKVEEILDTSLDSVDRAEEAVLHEAQILGFDEDDTHRIGIAVRECMVNAVVHGNCYNTRKKIRLKVERTADRLEVAIADEGDHFDMSKVPDPLSTENLMRDSGRGLLLMQAFMDEFQVRPCQPRGTEVKLVKYLAKAG